MNSLGSSIAAVLAIDPAADALEFDRVWWSWGELERRSIQLADMLAARGIEAGSRCAVVIRNRRALVPVLIALVSHGYCLASINGASPDAKLASDVRNVAAPVVIAESTEWDRAGLKEAVADSGALGLAVSDGDGEGVSVVSGLEGRSGGSWQTAEGIAIEMLSSGTTGTPKRIPLSARNLEQALRGAAKYEKNRSEDDAPRLRGGVQIVTAPMAHIAGITAILNNVLAGRKVCLIEKFSVPAFRDAVVRHKPKVAGAPPSALRMIMDANIPAEDFASLVAFRTGTAPLDPALADAFYERYGIPVLQNYGATEFAGGVAGWTLNDFRAHWKDKYGAVGRLNPGVDARIVSPDDRSPVASGEVGLLELRAPNVGSGKDWVLTNDLAVLDDDRFLWIKGRHDDAIIRGGFKISPDDIVNAIQAHPAVLQAAVCAMPDDRLGQVPVAGFILKTGASEPTGEEFDAFLRERLLSYQLPVILRRFDEFPRTPSMKVSQPELAAIFARDSAS